MKADTLTLKALFQKDVRYVIPTFQRPYVWTQEDQWEPLWDDLRNTAERYLDQLELAAGQSALAEERAGSHFLGAVVLQQRPTASAEIETRDVIDGQQRLTTMQLVIDAAQQALEELGATEAARLLRLVENDHAEGDSVFKLWPTSLDREPFRAAMSSSSSPEDFDASPIVQAHGFFRLQIREWIEAAPDSDSRARRCHGLETAIFGLLEVVVIDLSSVDDAFVIFETLNARGTPLLASDLVKNYVLQTAAAQKVSGEALYKRDWKPLEDKWWRTEVAQGRIVRPRIDVFLNYWLVMRTADEVPTPEVFPAFKAYVEKTGKNVEQVAVDLRQVGMIYRDFDVVKPLTVMGTFFYRWRIIDAGVSTPLILWLFDRAAHGLETERLERCLRVIESFLVRRMLCRMTTKDYNRLFLDLLSRLSKPDAGEPDEVILAYLAEQTAESRLWPDDRAFDFALRDLPLYRLLTRGRLRMVLEALEDALRTPKAESQYVERGTLTIEHVLPQKWQEHWPLPESGDPTEDAAITRDRLLHSLGNLTLVNNRLNPSLSNGSWAQKHEGLVKNSVLYLNKQLLLGFGNRNWAEDTIRERGKTLATLAREIWPASSDFIR